MKKLADHLFPLIVIGCVAFVLICTGFAARLAWRLICLGWSWA